MIPRRLEREGTNIEDWCSDVGKQVLEQANEENLPAIANGTK